MKKIFLASILFALGLPVFSASPTGSYPYTLPISQGTCESRRDISGGETTIDGQRHWRCVEKREDIKAAPKSTEVTQIICTDGGTAIYDGGKPVGCIVPPKQTNRDAAGNVISVVCPTGSSAYYQTAKGLEAIKEFITGEDAKFVGCLDPQKISEIKRVDIPTGSKIKQELNYYETQVPIPCDPSFGLGSCPSLQTPAGYIARVYQFGLMIVGLFAFGGIVYGALKYILSAGNVGSQQDAKDQITQAVLGLVLLLGAFIILYTINPSLTLLRNPNAPVLDLSVLTPPEEEDGQRQDLVGSEGGGDPLCAAALDAGVNLNISGQARTGQEIEEGGQAISGKVGEILGSSGEKRTGPQCLKCVANASGASGLFSKCVCDPGYEQAGSECIKK